VLALLAVLTVVTFEVASRRRALATDERALAMLTSSDAQALRLTAAPGVRPETHGVYRFRPGATTAVLTLSNLPPAPAGRAYQAWARFDGRWISLGFVRPDAAGKARRIAEGPSFAARPDELQVTVEPETGSSSPAGPVVIGWR
jgi:anti-sigma-K factor RskA